MLTVPLLYKMTMVLTVIVRATVWFGEARSVEEYEGECPLFFNCIIGRRLCKFKGWSKAVGSGARAAGAA